VSKSQRLWVFGIGTVALLVLLIPALRTIHPFGTAVHPLRDLAVAGTLQHRSANAVSSVNFDQRAFDTLGEELILLASVAGAAVLLRPRSDERETPGFPGGYVLAPVQLLTYVLLPVTVLLGIDVILHGHLTPGGGFQGGVVLATGLHLLYVGGTFQTLERLRPLEAFELAEAFGAAAFGAIGIAALAASSAFLADVLPNGTFADAISAGTVPLLSIAVGIEVASSVVVLLAAFLRQALAIRETADGEARS
jgi:multicomponent Na+:H+ antiporter subunit B